MASKAEKIALATVLAMPVLAGLAAVAVAEPRDRGLYDPYRTQTAQESVDPHRARDGRHGVIVPRTGYFYFGSRYWDDDYDARRHRYRYDRGDWPFLPGPNPPSMQGDR